MHLHTSSLSLRAAFKTTPLRRSSLTLIPPKSHSCLIIIHSKPYKDNFESIIGRCSSSYHGSTCHAAALFHSLFAWVHVSCQINRPGRERNLARLAFMRRSSSHLKRIIVDLLILRLFRPVFHPLVPLFPFLPSFLTHRLKAILRVKIDHLVRAWIDTRPVQNTYDQNKQDERHPIRRPV